MWFIADIFERYTPNFAKSFKAIVARETDATRRALLRLRDRRQRHEATMSPDSLAGHAEPEAAPSLADRIRSVPAVERAAVTPAPEPAVAAPTPGPVAVVAETPSPAPAEEAPAVQPAMPMGVRGDVVVKWVTLLANGERRQMADLLETLRKDKKVRVAELQMICAEALGEKPQLRKKVEHLDVLRRHFVPSAPARPAATPEMQLSAG